MLIGSLVLNDMQVKASANALNDMAVVKITFGGRYVDDHVFNIHVPDLAGATEIAAAINSAFVPRLPVAAVAEGASPCP